MKGGRKIRFTFLSIYTANSLSSPSNRSEIIRIIESCRVLIHHWEEKSICAEKLVQLLRQRNRPLILVHPHKGRLMVKHDAQVHEEEKQDLGNVILVTTRIRRGQNIHNLDFGYDHSILKLDLRQPARPTPSFYR